MHWLFYKTPNPCNKFQVSEQTQKGKIWLFCQNIKVRNHTKKKKDDILSVVYFFFTLTFTCWSQCSVSFLLVSGYKYMLLYSSWILACLFHSPAALSEVYLLKPIPRLLWGWDKAMAGPSGDKAALFKWLWSNRETEKTVREFFPEGVTALQKKKLGKCTAVEFWSHRAAVEVLWMNPIYFLPTMQSKTLTNLFLGEDCRRENTGASLESLMASICHLKNNKCDAFACAG